MSRANRAYQILGLSIRNLIFYGLWMTPIFLLLNWHWNFLYPAYLVVQNNPWKFFFAAMIWFFVSWLIVFLANLLWPTFLLMLFKTERLKKPKVIIQVGDRFRKMGLSSPQIYTTDEPHTFWKNKVLGFFALPSPFGALLLIPSLVIETLEFEKFDAWICQHVIESRFYKYSSFKLQLFLYLPFSIFIGLFAGHIFFSDSLFSYFTALIISIVTIGLLFFNLRQKIFDVDFRTIRSFHLDSDLYFSSLTEVQSNSLFDKLFSIQKRKAAFSEICKKVPADSSAPSKKPLLIGYASLFLLHFIVFISSFSIHHNHEFSLVAIFDSLNVVKTPARIPANTESLPTPVAMPAPISKAVLDGDIRQVVRALGSGVRLDFKDQQFDGATPLLLAIKKGDLDMVYVLLAFGARFTDVDQLGRNALFYALEAPNNLNAVRYALSGKVDPSQKAADGKTALDMAKEKKLIEIISLLESN